MIPWDEYQKNKPYWDYQRKIEYNKELLVTTLENNTPLEAHDIEEMFDELWSQVELDDYIDPPYGWIPKDPNWQIEPKI